MRRNKSGWAFVILAVATMVWLTGAANSSAQDFMSLTGDGNWEDTSIWSTGALPDVALRTELSGGFTVTFNANTGDQTIRDMWGINATLNIEGDDVLTTTGGVNLGWAGETDVNQSGATFRPQELSLSTTSNGVSTVDYLHTGGWLDVVTNMYLGRSCCGSAQRQPNYTISDSAELSVGGTLGFAIDTYDGQQWSQPTFKIVGSTPTINVGGINIVDQSVLNNPNGYTTVVFEADANGVSPINLTGSALLNENLEVDLSAYTIDAASITLIDNDGTDPFNGQFANVTATRSASGMVYGVNYTGGDGNDLILTKGIIWDNGGVGGNWGTAANWDPDTKIPDATTPAAVNSGGPLVEANHATLLLDVGAAGLVTIGTGNTLAVTTDANSAGTIALQNNSRLSTGGGSIAVATIDGSATIGVSGDRSMDVASVTPVAGQTTAELVKGGTGTLTLHVGGFDVSGLTLSGGTLNIPASVGEFAPLPGAVVHYSFDNAADLGHDDTENGRDAVAPTIVGDNPPDYSPDGLVGGAALFGGPGEGERDYLNSDGPTGVAGAVADGDHTVLVWTKDANTEYEFALGFWTATGGNKIVGGGLDQWEVLYNVDGGDTNERVYSNTPFRDGEWHMIGWTLDAANDLISPIVDGTAEATGPTLLEITDDHLFSIGQDWDGGSSSNFWTGLFDELYVYDRVLSASELAQVYGIQNADMSGIDLTVTEDSTFETGAPFDMTFKSLTLKNGILTTAGAAPSFDFTATTVDAAAGGVVGFDLPVSASTGPVSVVGNDPVTIAMAGTGDVILDADSPNLTANATFDVQAGRLIAVPATSNPLGAATLQLSGGEAVLAAGPDFDNRVVVTTDSVLTAGPGGLGVAGPQTVTLGSGTNGVNVAGGATLALRSTDDYTMNVAGNLSGDGGISIAEGTVTFSGSTNAIGTMKVTGGTVSTAGGEVTVSKELRLGDVNYTLSNAANFTAGNTVGGSNLLTGANLTLNGGTLAIGGGAVMPESLRVWLDASTISAGNGDSIATWADQSGNGNNATQGAAENQPTYVAASGLNGQPAVRFVQESDDWGDYLELGDLSAQFPTGATIFAVITSNEDDNTRYNVFGNRNNDSRMVAENWNESRPGSFRDGRSQDASFTYDDWLPDVGNKLIALESDSSVFRVLVNGTEIGNDTPAYHDGNGQNWLVGNRAGGGQALNGDIAEFLIFDSVLSAENANDIGGYLASKYGLTTTYDGGLGGDADQDTTNLTVTANSVVSSTGENVTLGNLTTQPGVTSLGLQGGVYSFQDAAIAGGVTVTGEMSVRGALDVGDGVAGTVTV
ncbi:MAG: hypothetical protein HQ567_26290, partial [Candidatus Nealsonbacteria bacterium]|nr:hypothetical protein [Candidatus Nealsonbacteria bacterium]